MTGSRDWNERYATGDTPWDNGAPSRELIRVLQEQEIESCRVLELGCGTGADAVYLATRGFTVVAMDVSRLAIERAEQRGKQAGVDIQFRAADLASAIELDGPFDLVFDAGCYHCVRETQLPDLMRLVERSTRPGSHWLSLAGNANDPHSRDHGPPRVTAEEICREWEPGFELVQLREFFFDSSVGPEAYHPLAWSILGRRRGDGSSGA